jgi:PPOX class probable F420-dependent enzyme
MPDLLALGDEPFVQLTSFRRTGVGVGTPVWIARDGTNLYVTTPADSGKVKRLRNDGTIELRPCGRRGAVDETEPPAPGLAEVRDDEQSRTHAHDLLRRKYGWQFRSAMAVERLFGGRHRVILVITLT